MGACTVSRSFCTSGVWYERVFHVYFYVSGGKATGAVKCNQKVCVCGGDTDVGAVTSSSSGFLWSVQLFCCFHGLRRRVRKVMQWWFHRDPQEERQKTGRSRSWQRPCSAACSRFMFRAGGCFQQHFNLHFSETYQQEYTSESQGSFSAYESHPHVDLFPAVKLKTFTSPWVKRADASVRCLRKQLKHQLSWVMEDCCVLPRLSPLWVSSIYTGTCGSVGEGDESGMKPGHQQRHKQDRKKKQKERGQCSNTQPWQTAPRPNLTSCQELSRIRFICPHTHTHTSTRPPSEWCSRWFVSSLASLESPRRLKAEPLCLRGCSRPTCPLCSGLLELPLFGFQPKGALVCTQNL